MKMFSIHSLYAVVKLLENLTYLYGTSSLLEHFTSSLPKFVVAQKEVIKIITNGEYSIQKNVIILSLCK